MSATNTSSARDEAILDVLRGRINNEVDGLTSAQIAAAAYDANPAAFKSQPNPSTAAAMMTGIFRNYPALHRAPFGNGYVYFYDENTRTPRTIEPRKARTNPNQEELFNKPSKKVKVKASTIKVRAAKKTKLAALVAPPAPKVPAYQLVNSEDGNFAGVLNGGVLYRSLEALVKRLNSTS